MAGVVPFPGQTPGRKQWNVKDRKSMRRFRSQLAEDGCPESQLVLAKQLLEEKSAVDVLDNEENARLGVFWLIKASEQGNLEATNILKQCFETGEGITEHNYLDVKDCLSTLQNEKLAKRAAREMFISLSAGQDFITSEQLRRRMGKINLCDIVVRPMLRDVRNKAATSQKDNSMNCLQSNSQQMEQEPLEYEDDEEFDESLPSGSWADQPTKIGEKITEEHLESAATTYSKGELPLVHRVLSLSDPHNLELQNLNYLQRSLLHPVLTIQYVYAKFLDQFSSRHRYTFPTPSHLQILLLFLCYPFIDYENVLLFIPWIIYYASFFTMIFSTFYMLQSKREYSNFRVWSRLFLSYDRDGNLNTDDAEFEYCKNHLRPFAFFFVSLLLNLLVYPFISEVWIPQSEFAIISFALTFLTLYAFHEKSQKRFDVLMLFSFGINVLARYPYETDGVVRQTWRFLDIELPNLQSYGLPCFASYVLGNGIEFCLNFRAVFYLLMPGLFLKMASRENWRGTYKVLIPHCVTLSWWQIAVLCSQGATLYGLIRSTLALVGFILFLPLVGLATLVLPIIAVIKHIADFALNFQTALVTLLASIPLLLGYLVNKRRGVQLGAYFSKVQIILAVIACVFLISPSINNYMSDTQESNRNEEIQVQTSLTYDQYRQVCDKVSWDLTNVASTQINCLQFVGLDINWEGIVDNVYVSKVHNPLQKVFDSLPELLNNKLTCVYGEKYSEECSAEELDGLELERCQVLKQVKSRMKKCHLQAWNKYSFDVLLKIKTNTWNPFESTINLKTDDCFRNFTLHLKQGDHIWFAGKLNDAASIGTENLSVTVEEMGCILCQNKQLTNLKVDSSSLSVQQVLKLSYDAFKYVLNFLFNPLVIFK